MARVTLPLNRFMLAAEHPYRTSGTLGARRVKTRRGHPDSLPKW